MFRFLPLILAATLLSSGLARADELTIEGVGIGRDVDCAGQDVGVYGSENAIVVTGRCGRITVHGTKHKVSFEQGAALAISGSDHTVTGGRVQDVVVGVNQNTVAATLDGGGTLVTSGAGNRVSLVLAGPARLEVMGVDQVVEWTRGEGVPNPKVTASGAHNVVRKKP